MSLGKHAVGRRPFGRLALLLALGMVVSAFAVGPLVGADEPPKKVWLCHFDTNHEAVQPYGDDRNGTDPGFWTVGPGTEEGTHLTGDYIVRYNVDWVTAWGTPEGLNTGQIALCSGNGGEFIAVSVNSLGEPGVKGHRALLQARNLTNGYPAGWKGPQD